MRLTINIPDPPKDQCLIDMSFHFLDGQLVEYTAPSGWVVKEQPKREKLLPCTCGRNSRTTWTAPNYYQYECNGCGRLVSGKTQTELRENWNDMIREEQEGSTSGTENP